MNGGEVIATGLRGSALLPLEHGISSYLTGIVHLRPSEPSESMGAAPLDGRKSEMVK
jgi:hypothetical protein